MDSVIDELPNEDLHLYFTEVTDSQQHDQEIEVEHTVLDEVEQARDFLLKAGLSDLSNIYQEGKEITEAIVNDSVREKYLTEKQAQTVRSRVLTLNKTLGNRKPRRKQRQDIRDVAWNVETSSTGSRSRSATPDSLDSVGVLNEELTSDDDQLSNLQLEGQGQATKGKPKLPSSEQHLQTKVFQRQLRENVAHLGSTNVVLKAYYPLEESQPTMPSRARSGSDPATDVLIKQFQNDSEGYLSSSPNFFPSSSPTQMVPEASGISFEGLVKLNKDRHSQKHESEIMHDVLCIDHIEDGEYQHLKPILWVEVMSIFDQYKISTIKRKQNKGKRGNVFNVHLSTLVIRDMPKDSENTMVPRIYQLVITQLINRCLKEDGIMRVGGQKQKLEMLCKDIEDHFYSNRVHIERVLSEASVHCLTGVLKKLLRDLPDSIFTMELIDMFYKTNKIPIIEDQIRALNLLILLLPVEHRNTFRYLVRFFLQIIANEQYNRMSLHNVAMIIAPSFFLPRILIPGYNGNPEKLSTDQMVKQINTAATCCNIMELVLKTGDDLWMVPNELVLQAREAQKKAIDRKESGSKKKGKAAKKKLLRSNTQYEPGAMLSPKISRDYML